MAYCRLIRVLLAEKGYCWDSTFLNFRSSSVAFYVILRLCIISLFSFPGKKAAAEVELLDHSDRTVRSFHEQEDYW